MNKTNTPPPNAPIKKPAPKQLPAPVGLERVPPQNIDAEQAVLGAMMLSKDAIDIVVELLIPSYFYRPAHKKIFGVITELYNDNKPADLITVSEELSNRNWLDDTGGRAYLAGLTEASPSIVNAEHHARIILDKASRYSIISTANSMLANAYDESQTTDELLDSAEASIFGIKEQTLKVQARFMKDIVNDAINSLEKARKEGMTGLPSGYSDLDKLTSGFQRSDLIIIACRPSVGKTSLALNITEYLSVDNNIPVLFLSLEMVDEQLAMRLLSSRARVSSHRMRNGYMKDDEWTQLSKAKGPISDAPITIIDSATMTVMEIRALARRQKAQNNIQLIVFDYLQLIAVSQRFENREKEVSYISHSLKALAKELAIPVIALSQLSRQVELRGKNAKPQLSDLRESGTLEQDADVVLFIHRDRDENGHWGPDAEILLSKQRNGPTGKIDLTFIKDYARFELTDKWHEPDTEDKVYRGD
jgi:replicative DNA helicase